MSSTSDTLRGITEERGLLALAGTVAFLDEATPLVFPWFSYFLYGSLPLVATTYVSGVVIPLILSLSLTPWMSHHAPKHILQLAQILRSGVLFTVIGISFLELPTILIIGLVLGSGAAGTATVLAEAAVKSAIPGSGAQLTKNASRIQQPFVAAQIIGPALAASSMGVLGPRTTLVILSAIATMSVLIAQKLLRGGSLPLARTRSQPMTQGFSLLWKDQLVRSLAFQAMIGNIGYVMVMSGFLYYLLGILRVSATAVSIVYLIIGGTSLIGTLIVPPLLRRLRRGILYPAFLLSGMCGLLVLQIPNLWAAGVGEGIVALCDTAWIVLSTGVRLERVPEASRPAVFTASRLVSNSLVPIGGIVVALAGGLVGFYVLFLAAACVKGSEALIAWFTPIRRLDANACCALAAMSMTLRS